MNLEFLIVTLIISKAVDWIFQSQWEATNKTNDVYALMSHTTIYAVLTTVFSVLIVGGFSTIQISSIFIFLWYSHFIIDNRYIVKQIMILKGLTRNQAYGKEYGWLQIGIDQRLHELVILAMALVI